MAKIEEVKEDDSPANKSEETASKPEPVVVVKDEHPVFKVIKNSNSEDVIESVRNFFEVDGVSVETLDGSGMTPLMHSCWKGNVAFVKFLIKQGADCNGGDHEHGYTSLHFASLAGKPDVCKLLLENGVKKDEVNSVKRTASQMAAFVGNHECVAIINNYVPKEDLYYYTRKQPFEEEPKMPLILAKPMHELVMTMNTHPVRIAMVVKANNNLIDHLPTMCKILELMSEREFKNRRDVNEVLSLKYHMLYYIVKDMKKQKEKDDSSDEPKKIPFIDRWIKSMIVGRDVDGYPVFQENFLRQGVKEFAFPESQLFKTLVANFHHCQNYGEGMTAADFINSAFNGQRGFKDTENCDTCGNENAKKKCSSCKSVQYCDQNCQKFHWFAHKKLCPQFKEKYDSRPKPKEQLEDKTVAAKEE